MKEKDLRKPCGLDSREWTSDVEKSNKPVRTSFNCYGKIQLSNSLCRRQLNFNSTLLI